MTSDSRQSMQNGHVVAKVFDVGWLPSGLACGTLWVVAVVQDGTEEAVKLSPALVLAVGLLACAHMRLRLTPTHLSRTVGPWRRSVNLASLTTINWRPHPGRGIIYVKDRDGGTVPIYVGRFTRLLEWGPLLLAAADRTGATVDPESRELLMGAGAARTRRGVV